MGAIHPANSDAEPSISIPTQRIESSILVIRRKKVMLDRDLAALYGVRTKALVQAVKRNISRFPQDFMFQLTEAELKNWRSQFVTSIYAVKMGIRHRPFAFTEQGVAMLSSVVRSERAVQVNIAIMRTFVHLREILSTNRDLSQRLDELEKKYDGQFEAIFDVIRRLMAPPDKPKKPIGFETRKSSGSTT